MNSIKSKFGISSSFLLLAIVMLFFYSCNKESNEIVVSELDPKADAALLELIAQSGDRGIPFPEGAKAFENESGSVDIKLPDGYKFILSPINEPSKVMPPEDGVSVICSCTKGSGGCSPVKAKGSYYCVMNDDCSNCTKSVSNDAGEVVRILGIYNPELSVSFVSQEKVESLKGIVYTQKEDVNNNVFEGLFYVDGVKKELMDFYKLIYSDGIPDFILDDAKNIPSGYSYVKVNLFGNEGAIPVPTEYLDGAMKVLPEDGDGKVSCTCLKGSGCTLSSMLGVKYCDAGSCTSCKLSD